MMTAYDRRFKEANDLPWSEAVFSRSDVPPPGEMRNTPGLSFLSGAAGSGNSRMTWFGTRSITVRRAG